MKAGGAAAENFVLQSGESCASFSFKHFAIRPSPGFVPGQSRPTSALQAARRSFAPGPPPLQPGESSASCSFRHFMMRPPPGFTFAQNFFTSAAQGFSARATGRSRLRKRRACMRVEYRTSLSFSKSKVGLEEAEVADLAWGIRKRGG